MNLLELLSQPAVITAKSYYSFYLGETEVKVPKYGDITGEEAEALDTLERKNAAWQGQFYDLLERVGRAKGITEPFKILAKFEELESKSLQEKSDYLGEFLGELIKLQGQNKSNLDQTQTIALLGLKRVDAKVTAEHLSKLPHKVLIDLSRSNNGRSTILGL